MNGSIRSWTLVAIALLLCPPGVTADPTLAKRRMALDSLLREQWEYVLRSSPEFASILGDRRYNDRVSDVSERAVRRDMAATRRFLARFKAIDTTGFPEQEQLNQRLMVLQLAERIEAEQFKDWEMPVNQLNGIHLDASLGPTLFPFQTIKDYRDYIKRLHRLPRQFDQTLDQMRKGEHDGLMPPRFLLEKVASQAAGIADTSTPASPFAVPLQKFPASIPKAQQEEIRQELLAAIEKDVVTAYRRFRDFMRERYASKGRTDPGVWALPDGAARYALAVRLATTTKLTPEAIHQLGMRQVAELEAAERTLASQLGFSDVSGLRAAVKADPKLHAHSGEEILSLYRKYSDKMYGKLPDLFTHLPKARMIVVATEPFREKDAMFAEYVGGSLDGSRPGRVSVNTYEYSQRSLTDIESTAYHEGVPGHHLQMTIAQEMSSLPMFRREGDYTAFQEGWALYSEKLGKEIGFYEDPYSEYGRIENELLRAVRLVVDTGLHADRWSRQQVVDYFHAHTGLAELEVQSETDRYIAWPAQALAYKTGELTILNLRDKAKATLGDRFDLRMFHDEVLGAGPLPLDVLEERIDAWIARRKSPTQ